MYDPEMMLTYLLDWELNVCKKFDIIIWIPRSATEKGYL